MSQARIGAKHLLRAVIVIGAVLATVSGVVAAIVWARDEFGDLPVYLCGAYLAGSVTTYAVMKAAAGDDAPPEAQRRSPS